MQERFARSRHQHAAKLGLNPLSLCKHPGSVLLLPKLRVHRMVTMPVVLAWPWAALCSRDILSPCNQHVAASSTWVLAGQPEGVDYNCASVPAPRRLRVGSCWC